MLREAPGWHDLALARLNLAGMVVEMANSLLLLDHRPAPADLNPPTPPVTPATLATAPAPVIPVPATADPTDGTVYNTPASSAGTASPLSTSRSSPRERPLHNADLITQPVSKIEKHFSPDHSSSGSISHQRQVHLHTGRPTHSPGSRVPVSTPPRMAHSGGSAPREVTSPNHAVLQAVASLACPDAGFNSGSRRPANPIPTDPGFGIVAPVQHEQSLRDFLALLNVNDAVPDVNPLPPL